MLPLICLITPPAYFKTLKRVFEVKCKRTREARIERRCEGRLQWRAVIGRIQLAHKMPFGGLQRKAAWQFAACIQIYLIVLVAFLITLLIREFLS